MSSSKNFFFFAAAIGILILAGDKVYRLWLAHHDEQVVQAQFTESRKHMDKYYAAELERTFIIYMNSEKKLLQEVQLNNTIKAIELKMIQDGYSNADAGLIKQQVLSRIYHR